MPFEANSSVRPPTAIPNDRSALAAVFAVLSVGIVVSSTLFVRARQERDRALAAEAKAESVTEFLLEDMLTLPDPEKAQGKNLTVRDALDAASARG